MDMLHSTHIPKVPYSPDITDLFRNFALDWATLSPVTSLLFGVLFGFFVLGLLVKRAKDE